MATESFRNVKLLCSFGGRILPRPSDSKLRYAGGETHIITIRRSVTISDFFLKISQIFDGTIVAVKYQLPDEDLDTLISISCQEDFDNMLDELDRISDVSADGSAKIRVFLFDDTESDISGFSSEMIDNGQVYCKAINDGWIKTKKSGSFSNATSDMQNDASSMKSELGFCVDENLGKVGNSGSKGIISAVSGEVYNNYGTELECIDMNSHNNGASDSNTVHDIGSKINNVIFHQPLNPLTQLHPVQILPCDAFHVPTQRCSQPQAVILNNHGMFEKPLLHAQSGMLINEQLTVNAGSHGDNRGGSLFRDQGSMLMSYQFVDPRGVQASVRPSTVEGVAINSNERSLELISEFYAPVVRNTAIAQVEGFHGDFNNSNMATRDPWLLMNGSKPQSQGAQSLHSSNAMNFTRPLEEDQTKNGNTEALEYPLALRTPITRVDSEGVETFNLPQNLHVPITADTSRQQASFEFSRALYPPTNGTHSPIQINKGTTEALEHLQSLQLPNAMNTSRPQVPVQVNNANVETQKYAQVSQAPININSNVETLENLQEWDVPLVGNTTKAPVQEFHFQINCQNMSKREPLVVMNGTNPLAPTQVNNLERIEHDRTLHASNVVSVTMPPANVQVNTGTMATSEQPQVFHASATRNTMSRTQDKIQIISGTLEATDRSQNLHVPSGMNTSTLQAHVKISNGTMETTSQLVLPSQPSYQPMMDAARPQTPILVNRRVLEPLELQAPVAMDANRPQAQIQSNKKTLKLVDHVQASQVPIAMNVTRPQTPIKVNSKNFENKEHSQALYAPESMNTSRLQAHAQAKLNNDAAAKSESKIEEVQVLTGIPCGTCGHTREIIHMREKESWSQMNVSSTKESAGETHADNMTAKTQFATFTDGSAPEIAQSEDDGLLKNPSAPTMVHSHFPDLFQTLSQNVNTSLDHMLNQGVATKLVNDESSLVTDLPSRMTVPEFCSAYVRPANGTMLSNNAHIAETRNTTDLLTAVSFANVVPIMKSDDFISFRENSHGTSQARPISHLLPYPLNTTIDLDGNQVLISQAGGSSLHVGNDSSYIMSDGIPCRQIKHMQPPKVFDHLNGLQTSDTDHGSTMMSHRESLISFGENKNTQPEYTYTSSSSLASDYPTSNAMPVQISATVPIQYTNATHVTLVGNDPIQYASSSCLNGRSVCPNEPASSLFCNLGHQKNPSDIHMVPLVPITVSSTELVPPLDLCPDHLTSEKCINAAPVFLQEGGDQHIHSSTMPIQYRQGEGKDIQALTGHIMATVLEPSRPLSPTKIPHETNSLDLSFNKDEVLCDANSPTQKAMVAVGDQKFEGTSKQVDMSKVGFPPTDDLGRLQIIKNDDLEELDELGSGSYGTVYHGKWKGSDVAIKRINERCFAGKPSEEERMKSDFWNEACNLAGLHHPNIVAFYGVVLDGPNGSFATVTEFMVNGSLRRALLKNEKILDIRKRLLIAMDVAFGMEYLHSKNMIHFDLKSDNLLVNLRDPQRPICKIADLGLSKVKRQTLISGGMRGTLPWMAPELLNGNSSLVSNKVDVFSFGIVMWELITGQEPYHDLHQGTIIGGIVSNTLRPPVPESCDPDWRSLMEQCWSQEPSDRPTFVEIASRLRSMAASLPQK